MNKKLLLIYLKEWFASTDFSKVNIWNRNKIAELIKSKIYKLGHWKDSKRGNPKKAFRLMKEQIARNNGWESNNE